MSLTIVLATYNRPDSLNVAIRSVLLQTLPDWRLLVVGDGCDERTERAVADFADARIAYVNLPSRCGEQALPNSIGMALARSEFIALLNHDDVLLADHLALAVARLRETGGDLFVGKAAFARFSAALPDGRRMPIFSEVTPAERTLRDVFSIGCEVFEPCSAWVFRRQLSETVGPWRPAAALYRTPMEDWLLRAWRAGARLVQADDISVLRMLTHYQQAKGKMAYAWGHGEHEMLGQLIENVGPADVRRMIHDRLSSNVVAALPKAGFSQMMLKMLGRMNPEQEWLAAQLLTPTMADVYFRTGWDAFEQFCVLAGFEKGHLMGIALRIRTGEALPPQADFDALLAFARARLAIAE